MPRRIPIVTFALVALNAAVHVLGPRASSQCDQAAFAQRYGAVPWELTHNRALPLDVIERAARCPMPDFEKTPALSALTSTFVHASAAHLIGNMMLLLLVGCIVEQRMGPAKFTAFYLVCGYTAAYGFAFTVPSDTRPLIGASGAIAGVLGAHLWLRPRDPVIPLLAIPFLVPLPGPAWLVGQPGSNVAYTAHAVGLVAGLALAALWVGTPANTAPTRGARDTVGADGGVAHAGRARYRA